MAKMTINAGEDYALKLSRYATDFDSIAKKAIYAGVKPVADAIKNNLENMPEEKFRYLRDGDKFVGVPEQQKKDLIDSFGVTSIDYDKNGDWNAKIGFDGYGSTPTKQYPKGLPNQMVARSIESGSSVRQKKPFVRPAVNSTKKRAQAEMNRVIDEETKKLFG